MSRFLPNWIAFRYFRSKKRTGLISFTSWVSILGIAIGAFALLVTLSILNGFEQEISRRVVDLESHLRVSGKMVDATVVDSIAIILENSPVHSLRPFVLRKSILTSECREAVVRIKAIDPEALAEQFVRPETIIRGTAGFSVSTAPQLPGLLLGFRLADRLGLYIGDTLTVINPLRITSGFSMPTIGRFVLAGVFKLDLFDYDENLVLIGLTEGQRIFEMNATYSGVDIKFDQYRRIDDYKNRLSTALSPELAVSSWEDLHRSLFGAMKLEKYGSFAALSFIILVAIFNLTSSLIMLVMEKIREIGMLQAMGLNRDQIRQIFFRLGLLTGSLGLFTGVAIAAFLLYIQQHYQIIQLPPVYFIPYLPVVLEWPDVLMILGAGLILIVSGTIYPSWRISRLMPLEAIRFEK